MTRNLALITIFIKYFLIATTDIFVYSSSFGRMRNYYENEQNLYFFIVQIFAFCITFMFVSQYFNGGGFKRY